MGLTPQSSTVGNGSVLDTSELQSCLLGGGQPNHKHASCWQLPIELLAKSGWQLTSSQLSER